VLDDELLRYKYLGAFDAAMNHLEAAHRWLAAPQAYVSLKHEGDKVVAYERAGLLFVFNFHPTKSFEHYRVGVGAPGTYAIVLSSDDKRFGGFANIDTTITFKTTPEEWDGRANYVQVRACRWISFLGRGGSHVTRCISRRGRCRSSRWQNRCDEVEDQIHRERVPEAPRLLFCLLPDTKCDK
jgi:hypothetical protein